MSSHLRSWLVLATLSAVAGAVATPAMASNQSVSATSSNTWSPASVAVNAGESVHFSNSNDGTHDLRFDGEAKSVTPLSASGIYDRTFSTAGTFGYYCTVHTKMHGTVVVQQAATTAPTGTTPTSATTTTTNPPPASVAIAVFTTSPKHLRVSKTGRFRYSFLATALSSGKIGLKSTKKVTIGSTSRFIKVTRTAFTAPSTSNVRVTFKLSSKNLRAFKRVKRLGFVVTAVLGAKTFTTKITLKASPTTSGA